MLLDLVEALDSIAGVGVNQTRPCPGTGFDSLGNVTQGVPKVQGIHLLLTGCQLKVVVIRYAECDATRNHFTVRIENTRLIFDLCDREGGILFEFAPLGAVVINDVWGSSYAEKAGCANSEWSPSAVARCRASLQKRPCSILSLIIVEGLTCCLDKAKDIARGHADDFFVRAGNKKVPTGNQMTAVAVAHLDLFFPLVQFLGGQIF